MFIIYLITNIINAKKYIGFTSKSKEDRWNRHKYMALHRGSKQHLHCAIRKYGIENFKVEILEEGVDSNLGKNVREAYWISLLNPEYNHTVGGEGTLGSKRTNEWKRNRRKVISGFDGRTHTEKTKLLMSKKKMGNSYHLGFLHSNETKRKMSDKKRGKVYPKVSCIWCGIVGGGNVMKRYHFDNCRNH